MEVAEKIELLIEFPGFKHHKIHDFRKGFTFPGRSLFIWITGLLATDLTSTLLHEVIRSFLPLSQRKVRKRLPRKRANERRIKTKGLLLMTVPMEVPAVTLKTSGRIRTRWQGHVRVATAMARPIFVLRQISSNISSS